MEIIHVFRFTLVPLLVDGHAAGLGKGDVCSPVPETGGPADESLDMPAPAVHAPAKPAALNWVNSAPTLAIWSPGSVTSLLAAGGSPWLKCATDGSAGGSIWSSTESG